MIPQTREDWETDRKLYALLPDRVPTAEETIRLNVDWLLGRCYTPDIERGSVVSRDWLAILGLSGLHDEPINWGDLGCSEVKAYADGTWEVTIEEAAPDCPGLQEYIHGWLKQWGWETVVRTEW